MSDLCTSEEAMGALTYLRHSFGGWGFEPPEERSFLRTFGKCTRVEVLEAIEHLKGRERRPSPSDIEAVVIASRRSNRVTSGPYQHEIPESELTPPEEIPERVKELRQKIGAES